MSGLASLFGAAAVLLPLAAISVRTAAAAVGVAVAGVALLWLVETELPGAPLAVLVVAPLFGVGVLASAVVHVDIATLAAIFGTGSGPPPDLVGIVAGSVAGVVGATALLALFAGSLGLLSVSTVSDAFRSVVRVSVLFLVATTVSAGVIRTGIVPARPPDLAAAVGRWGQRDPRGASIVSLTLAAFVGPFALWTLARVRRLATSPLEPVALRAGPVGPDSKSPEAIEDTDETGETDETDEIGETAETADSSSSTAERVVVWSVVTLMLLAFVRPVVVAGLQEVNDPRAAAFLAANEALTAAVTTPGVFRALYWSFVGLIALYAITAVVGRGRKRVDRRGSLLGTTGALAVVVAGIGVAIHALRPVYEPLVATPIRAAVLAPSAVADAIELLPALLLGGILLACALGLGLLAVIATYGGMHATVADGLVYRNFVFACTMVAVIAAAVAGVTPAVIFGGAVAALLAWDFLEYGYALAVELDSRSLQPPEIAHAASSVGVGVALIGASLGAYELGRRITPPAEISYAALPVLVFAAVLLLVYFTE